LDPLWELTALPPDPLAGLKGGEEGNDENGGQERAGRGRVRELRA